MKYLIGILLYVLSALPAHAADLSAAMLTTLSGQSQKLSDYRGKYVLVHFWASWCAPCIAEFPTLVKLAADMPNVTILAVSVDEEPQKSEKFIQKQIAKKLYPKPLNKVPNFVLVQDPQKQLSQDVFGTFQYPETVLLNPQLQPVYKWVGPQNWSHTFIETSIKSH